MEPSAPPLGPSHDETLESLGPGLAVLQKKRGFRFGIDAVLLAHFAAPRPHCCGIDLGCGSGVVPLLLARQAPYGHFTGIEIQSSLANLARRSVALSLAASHVTIVQGDLRNASELASASFDLVTANPPYKTMHQGSQSPDSELRQARCEMNGSLADFTAAAARLLVHGGRFCIVHRPTRLTDVMDTLRCHGLEPKRLRMVQASCTSAPKLVLVEGKKGAMAGLRVLPPLILTDEQGNPTPEVQELYGDYGV